MDHGAGPGGGVFYIRTNADGRRNFRLVAAPVDDPRPERWQELIAHRDDVMLEDVDVFAAHYVVHERDEGPDPPARHRARRPAHSHHVEFPEPTYELSRRRQRGVRTAGAIASATSRSSRRPRCTTTTWPDAQLGAAQADAGARRLRSDPLPLGAHPRDGRRRRPRPDLARLAAPGTPRDGSSPLLLTGYGAYGIPYPVTFSSSRLSLLDRGVTVAIAHIRGGGELGKRWHDDGRMLGKRNTFTDFIAAADAWSRAATPRATGS